MADIPLDQYQEQTPFGLYSHAAETAAALPQAKGTPDQLKAMLMKQGVKPAEIEHSGYDDVFAGRPSVTKDELVQHFRQGMPRISEALLSKEPKYANYATGPSRYHSYTIPGGENYREVILKAPPTEDPYKHGHWPGIENPLAHIRMSDRTGSNGEKILHVEELQSDWAQTGRTHGVVDPKEKKAYDAYMQEYRALANKSEELAKLTEERLGIKYPEYEEILSLFPEIEQISKRMNHLYMNGPDRPEGVPYHPLITNTGAWTDLALKKVLHEASHGGYDKVVFTPGEEQAARFDLSNHLSRIVAVPTNERTIHLDLHDHEDPETPFETVRGITPEELPKHVGKELAERIMKEIKFPEDQKVWQIRSKVSNFKTGTTPDFDRIQEVFEQYPENVRSKLEIVPVMQKGGAQEADLRGLDLKVGGEGMKGFYDKILPEQLNALVKKHDPQVRMRRDTIETPAGTHPVHALDITPKLRESILRGQKAFAAGGEVDDDGITAYHGSPHDFEQFDISKIGTGEGAQAYGHGLYFAGAEPVAQTYRGDPEERYRRFSGHMDPKEEYAFDLASHAGDIRDFDVMMGLAKKYGENIDFEEAQRLAEKAVSKRGHMYEVNIAAHPDHFLDWDSKIEDHPEIAQQLFEAVNKSVNVHGEQYKPSQYETIGDWMGHFSKAVGPLEASRRLKEAGIPGIKYLDAGSRNTSPAFDPAYLERQIAANRSAAEKANENERRDLDEDHQILLKRLEDAKAEKHLSRNYVVFDDKLVGVKRKYARGGVVNG